MTSWNKEVFGHLDTKITELEEEISFLDIKAETSDLDELEISTRKGLIADCGKRLQ